MVIKTEILAKKGWAVLDKKNNGFFAYIQQGTYDGRPFKKIRLVRVFEGNVHGSPDKKRQMFFQFRDKDRFQSMGLQYPHLLQVIELLSAIALELGLISKDVPIRPVRESSSKPKKLDELSTEELLKKVEGL